MSGPFSRLTLLMALAVGVGLFSLTYQTTITRASADQAYYLAGADERVIIKSPDAGTQLTGPYRAKFAQMPGVRGVTPLYRSGGYTSDNYGSQNVDMLGVDPANFAHIARWRDDYADQPLATLMNDLRSNERGASAGDGAHPIAALVDDAFARTLTLSVGSKFELTPQESLGTTPLQFVVVGFVHAFPTMYDRYPAGYLIVNVNDLLAALGNPALSNYPINGPNEYLLTTTPDQAAAAQRARDLADPNYFVDRTLDARILTAQYQADPLSAGVMGLLLAGAGIVALLAMIGVLTQAAVAARLRGVQLAILRTFGMGRGALVRMLLIEQSVIYMFGALSGIGLSALLAYASLPFMGFSSSTYRPPVLGVPAALLAVNSRGSVYFLAALLAACALALVVAAVVGRSAGLGSTLRIGED